jgi:hypothetical protein
LERNRPINDYDLIVRPDSYKYYILHDKQGKPIEMAHLESTQSVKEPSRMRERIVRATRSLPNINKLNRKRRPQNKRKHQKLDNECCSVS